MDRKSVANIVFSPAVRTAQQERGSRDAYARMEDKHGFPDELDERLVEFISQRDSFYLGTASRSGQPYVQHRGGSAGFLKVLDAKTLAFGDVAGNAQYITVGNLSENNQAFIFLMDYPNRRRVKLWGTAYVVEDDAKLLKKVTVDETPERVIVFRLTTWNWNCPKNIQQRWTSDESGQTIQLLAEQADQLRRENRHLKRQLNELTKTDG